MQDKGAWDWTRTKTRAYSNNNHLKAPNNLTVKAVSTDMHQPENIFLVETEKKSSKILHQQDF